MSQFQSTSAGLYLSALSITLNYNCPSLALMTNHQASTADSQYTGLVVLGIMTTQFIFDRPANQEVTSIANTFLSSTILPNLSEDFRTDYEHTTSLDAANRIPLTTSHSFFPGDDIPAIVSTLPEDSELWFFPGIYYVSGSILLKAHQSVHVVQSPAVDLGLDALYPEKLTIRNHCNPLNYSGYYLTHYSQSENRSLEADDRNKALFLAAPDMPENTPLLVLTGEHDIHDVVLAESFFNDGIFIRAKALQNRSTIHFYGTGFLCSLPEESHSMSETCSQVGYRASKNNHVQLFRTTTQETGPILSMENGNHLLIETPPKRQQQTGKASQATASEQKRSDKPAKHHTTLPGENRDSGSASGGDEPPDWNSIIDKKHPDLEQERKTLLLELLRAAYNLLNTTDVEIRALVASVFRSAATLAEIPFSRISFNKKIIERSVADTDNFVLREAVELLLLNHSDLTQLINFYRALYTTNYDIFLCFFHYIHYFHIAGNPKLNALYQKLNGGLADSQQTSTEQEATADNPATNQQGAFLQPSDSTGAAKKDTSSPKDSKPLTNTKLSREDSRRERPRRIAPPPPGTAHTKTKQ